MAFRFWNDIFSLLHFFQSPYVRFHSNHINATHANTRLRPLRLSLKAPLSTLGHSTLLQHLCTWTWEQAFQDCRQSPYRIPSEPHLASRGICFCHLAYTQLHSSSPIVNATLMKYELLLGGGFFFLKTASKNLYQTKLP